MRRAALEHNEARQARRALGLLLRARAAPMFDVPAEPVAKPKPVKRLRNDKGEPLSAFASEVRRQRLERDR
jgi:hypothetical protein